MKKILPVVMIMVVLSAGPSAAAQIEQFSQSSLPVDGGTLEPLIHFEVKNPVHMVASERFAAVAAWSSEGPQAVIIDIGDPTHPIETATILFPNIDYSLVGATNGVLYVSKGGDGLLVYDLSDLANPLLVSQFEPIDYMSVHRMVIDGDLAYLSDNSLGLVVLDISDPLHPALLGVNNQERASSLAIQGHYVYATSTGGLIIYDISNPAQPTVVGRYSNPSRPPGIVFTVQGSYAYLPGSINQYPDPPEYYTDVIDISNPGTPVRVTDIPQLAVSIQTLSVNNGLLYALRSGGLAIYSIADPLDPQQLGLFPTGFGTGMIPQGDQAFLIDYNTGFLLLDTTDPALPSLKGFLSWPQSATLLVSKGTDLYSVETDIQCAPDSGENSIIRVIDVQNPLEAQVSGFFVLEDNPCGKPFIDGSMIYFPGTLGVTILNASDPVHMQVASRIGSWSARDVEVLDGVAYAIFDRNGTESSFTITDISDPSAPLDLNKIVFPEYLNGLSIAAQGENKYAYLIGGGALIILDVTDPLNPFEVYRYPAAPPIDFVDTENRGSQTIAYLSLVAGHMPPKPAGILALDVSNPSQPFVLGTFPIMGGVPVYDVADGIVYFRYDPGLILVDFNDPSHPQQVASAVDPNGPISDATANEQYLFTATPYQPITVFALINDLSGRVTDHNINPISGVSLTLSTGAGALTGADGAYSFPDLSAGDYVVTPTLGLYVFSPPERQVNIPSDLSSQDFIILPPPVSAILDPGITTTLTYTDVQGLPTSFIFPSGLVSSTAIAHITPTLASGFFGSDFAGHAFELAIEPGLPTDQQEYFTVPVSVTIQYSLDDAAGITDTTRLALYRSDGTSWTEADDGCVPPSAPFIQEPGIFEGMLCQQGLYALFGPTFSIALPFETIGSISQSCDPPNCIP